MSDLSIQPTNVQQKKKMSPVKKGALIGAAIPATTSAISTTALATFNKDIFKECANICGNKGKFLALIAIGTAVASGFWAGIGAGIGKIVEICKNKKAQKTQAEG